MFVGGQLCTNSQYGRPPTSDPSLQAVVCTLRPGTARDLPISVLQSGGVPVRQSAWISYANCPDAHRTVVTDTSVTCVRCTAGTAPDSTRRVCVSCPPGQYSPGNVNCTVGGGCARCLHVTAHAHAREGVSQWLPELWRRG